MDTNAIDPFEKAKFKEYQRGTIEGMEAILEAMHRDMPDEKLYSGADLKRWIGAAVAMVRAERDAWEREFNL